MAGGKSWKLSRRLEISRLKIVVIIVEQLHESVGVAFGVTAGIRSVWTRGGTKERRVLDKYLVRLIAPPDPERVRFFGVPSERTFASVDFEMKFAFAASAYLRNGKNSFRTMIQVYQHGRVVVCFDRHLIGSNIFCRRKRFDVPARLVAHWNHRRQIGA